MSKRVFIGGTKDNDSVQVQFLGVCHVYMRHTDLIGVGYQNNMLISKAQISFLFLQRETESHIITNPYSFGGGGGGGGVEGVLPERIWYGNCRICQRSTNSIVPWSNMSILWSPLKIWTPKDFTTANFRHPVSKSWLRHCCALVLMG